MTPPIVVMLVYNLKEIKCTTLHQWYEVTTFHIEEMSWGKISKMIAIPWNIMVAIVKLYRGLGVVRSMSKFGRPSLLSQRYDCIFV
jgi:hypothetical protein